MVSAGVCLFIIFQMEKSQRTVFLQVQKSNFAKLDAKELGENRDRLQFLVALDSVTGIANRNSFDRALKSERNRAARSNSPLSLLLVDIDNFTTFNEENGRSIADDVLQKVAAEIKRFARRQGDMAARFDQDCFAVLLADTEGVNAGMVARSIARNVEAIKEDDSWANVTVCIGVGSLSPSPKTFPADLIGASICALQAAKKRGVGEIYNLTDADGK